jgi:hypothetical protein
MKMDFTMEELKCIKNLIDDSIDINTWDSMDQSSLQCVEYMHFFLQRAKVLAKLRGLIND